MDQEQLRHARTSLAMRVTPVPSGCIEWTGGFGGSRKAYGRMSFGRGQPTIYAHRVAYELHHGHEPGDLQVLHQCDNPKCVNPKHLFLGTQDDNMKDMAFKGRGGAPKGEAHRSRKLTAEQVRAIRKSNAPIAVLAAAYGVSKQTVYAARSRICWKHVL